MNCLFHSQFSYELIVAFIAIIISFISVILTWWTILNQRKHNRLSVKPIPEIILSKIDGVFITLMNKGIGPLSCIELITKDESGIIKNHLYDFLPEGLSNNNASLFTDRWEFTIMPNESITLFSIILDDNNETHQKDKEAISETFSKLAIEIKYTSIYNETFPIYKKSLIWFKRKF